MHLSIPLALAVIAASTPMDGASGPAASPPSGSTSTMEGRTKADGVGSANKNEAEAGSTRRSGEAQAQPGSHETLDCALRQPAKLTIQFGRTGCFGKTDSTLSLTVASGGRGRLKGEFQAWDASAKKRVPQLVDRALSKKEVTKAVRALSAAIARLESPSECGLISPLGVFARLEWTCGKSQPGKLEYTATGCGALIVPGMAAKTSKDGQHGYMRASGVSSVAQELLLQYSEK